MSKSKKKEKILTPEEQLLATEKVLQEMKNTEEAFKASNATWKEQYLHPYCKTLQKTPIHELEDIERKYNRRYLLTNFYQTQKRIGKPLKIVTIEDNNGNSHTVEFGRVDWYRMESKKPNKSLTFINDGTIRCSQEAFGIEERGVTYDATMNVLSSDFQYVMMVDAASTDPLKLYHYNYYSFVQEGNMITERWNDTEIQRDLEKGTRKAFQWKDRERRIKKKISDPEIIDATESIIIDRIKAIKEELPISGLVERIDQCLKRISEQNELEQQKVYKKNKKPKKPNDGGEN